MTALGWIFLISSLGFVCGLAGRCFYRLLTADAEGFTVPPDSLGG